MNGPRPGRSRLVAVFVVVAGGGASVYVTLIGALALMPLLALAGLCSLVAAIVVAETVRIPVSRRPFAVAPVLLSAAAGLYLLGWRAERWSTTVWGFFVPLALAMARQWRRWRPKDPAGPP